MVLLYKVEPRCGKTAAVSFTLAPGEEKPAGGDKATGGEVSLALRVGFGYCPAGCSGRLPNAVVYRSSKRSITLRCPTCGLLWTMTVQQMAKSATRTAEQMATSGSEHAPLASRLAEGLGEWSTAIGDTRERSAG